MGAVDIQALSAAWMVIRVDLVVPAGGLPEQIAVAAGGACTPAVLAVADSAVVATGLEVVAFVDDIHRDSFAKGQKEELGGFGGNAYDVLYLEI